MSQIGTIVLSQEIPPAVANPQSTANAFMIGLADWGPAGSAVTTPYTSLSQVAAAIGPPNGGLIQNSRTSNNATLYDAADVFFREGGSTLYISRVLGPTPTKGSLILQDNSSGTAATLTATYYGDGSSSINVVVTNSVSSYTVTLQDGNGNVLAVSPSLTATNKSDLITWAATTNLVVATAGNTNLPETISATPLSAGTDNRSSATLTNWSTALNTGFPASLGPGQVMAPAQTNTALAGIWSVLGTHAQSNNRVALLDGTDGNTASQAIAEVTGAAIPSSLQGYCALWAGNLQMPGIVSGTTRVVPPSPVVAALCARADFIGNPNTAAAGIAFPLQYVSGINTIYTNPLTGDIANLNSAGINVFSFQYGILQNFGFVSLLALPTTDAIYWQFSHCRLRMAIIYQSLIVAQPYQFAQIDGQGTLLAAFQGTLQGMLLGFYNVGALYGDTASDAFTVNVGTTVNTPATISAGNLIAYLAVRMSPFAQLVTITINAVPITQSLVNTSSTASLVP